MSEETRPQVDELFGDDDLGSAPPSGAADAEPAKKGGGKIKLILGLVGVVVLAILWFVSSAHHENYYLIVEGDMVRVERGYFFPVGSGAFAPSNPAYAPFRLPGEVEAPASGEAMSLEKLDSTLYDLYVAIATQNLQDFVKGDPDFAEEMLRRANKLGSSSRAADRKLLQMRGDVAFRRGLKEVRGIQTRFDMALEQFQDAARQGGEAFQGADQWVEAIQRLRNEFRALSIQSGLDPDLILSDGLPAAAPAAEGEAPAAEGDAPAEPPAEGAEEPAQE